jgi:hypothetical protein
MPCLCAENQFLTPQFLRENESGKRRGGQVREITERWLWKTNHIFMESGPGLRIFLPIPRPLGAKLILLLR